MECISIDGLRSTNTASYCMRETDVQINMFGRHWAEAGVFFQLRPWLINPVTVLDLNITNILSENKMKGRIRTGFKQPLFLFHFVCLHVLPWVRGVVSGPSLCWAELLPVLLSFLRWREPWGLWWRWLCLGIRTPTNRVLWPGERRETVGGL